MTLKSLLSACAFVFAAATAGSAATYNLGDVTNGVTVSKKLTVKTLDFFTFSLDAPSKSFVSGLEISVTSTARSNFSEMIGLYDGATLIGTASAARGGGKTATLSFSSLTGLTEGTYTLGVGGWISHFKPNIADFFSTAFFRNGNYTVSITPTLTEVPLPAGGLLILTGLGALALTARKKRKAAA